VLRPKIYREVPGQSVGHISLDQGQRIGDRSVSIRPHSPS
jgi:hypothetical protein